MRGYQQSDGPSRKYKHRSKAHSPHRRSRSYEKERSRSRSKGRKHKRHQIDFPVKIESDIKNHFKFTIPHLRHENQSQAIAMLKNRLTSYIGPVEHISRSKDSRGEDNVTINVGFKYDIDAMSSLRQIGDITLEIGNRQIHTKSYPTRVFERYIPQITKSFAKKEERNGQRGKKRKSAERKRSSSYSSYSRSERQSNCENDFRGHDPVHIWHTHIHEGQIVCLMVRIRCQIMNGEGQKIQTVSICRQKWKHIKQKQAQTKGQKMLKYKNKLEIGGFPVVMIEDDIGKLSDSLKKYQICLSFPQRVFPCHVKKGLQQLCKVVQIVANQQLQEGQSKSYIITLNEKSVVGELKKVGRLGSGIMVQSVKEPHYVYRPLIHSN